MPAVKPLTAKELINNRFTTCEYRFNGRKAIHNAMRCKRRATFDVSAAGSYLEIGCIVIRSRKGNSVTVPRSLSFTG